MSKDLRLPRQLGKKGRRGIAILMALLFTLAGQLSASVLVAPTSVYLSEKDRTGRMTVQNPSDSPKEISVRFSWGIPISDSLGNVQIRLVDSGVTDPKAATEWIKVFPRKMVLAPGASQVIRFVARPPKNLPDGEYWTRVVIRSEGSQTEIPMAGQNENITTRLNMIMQTAIILKYRTGNLIAKLDVKDTRLIQTDSSVRVLVEMANRGNVSYVGTFKARLLDINKNEISNARLNLAVYHDLTRKLDLPLPEGNRQKPHTIEISIANDERKDLPPEGIISGNRILYTVSIE